MKDELVKDWMTTHVVTISADATVPEAEKLMRARGIRRLPVVDRRGRLLGLVTYGDIRDARPSSATSLSVWELNYLLAKLKVSSIMTAKVITLTPEATIGEAALVMLTYKISGLPVMDDDGKLAGIITESDIFRMIVHQWKPTVEQRLEPVPALV